MPNKCLKAAGHDVWGRAGVPGGGAAAATGQLRWWETYALGVTFVMYDWSRVKYT